MSISLGWRGEGACRGTDPDALFETPPGPHAGQQQPGRPVRERATGAAQNRAKTVCTGCPVRLECLAYALDNREGFGVWGGMTQRERRALLRSRPNVTSWRHLLENAQAAAELEAATGARTSAQAKAS